MGLPILDHAPVHTPITRSDNSPMNAIWAQWFETLRQQVMTSANFTLSDPYPELIHIVGGDGIGILVEQNIGSPGVNKGYYGISSIVTVLGPITAATTGIVGMAGVGYAVGGGGGVWGMTAEAWTGNLVVPPTSNSAMTGIEASIIQQYSNNAKLLTGISVVFKDRPDGVASTFSGLGSNKYGFNSAAMYISSQARSSAGEHCGWQTGILFAAKSMDSYAGGAAVGIDISNVPITDMPTAIQINDLAYVEWSNTLGACQTRYDNTINVWGITVTSGGTTPYFAVELGTGRLYLYGPQSTTVGAAGAAAALPANPVGYLTSAIGGISYKMPYYNV